MSMSKRFSLLLLSTSLLFTSACSDDTLLQAAIEFIETSSQPSHNQPSHHKIQALVVSAPLHTPLGWGRS